MKSGLKPARAEIIARLNDHLRLRGQGGQMVLTQGVLRLPLFDARVLKDAIAGYNRFDAGNDPYEERDFGVLELFDVKLNWKIDYYDLNLEFGSEDPANPEVTHRVLTVFLPEEY